MVSACRETGSYTLSIEHPPMNMGSNFSSLTARAGFNILSMAGLTGMTGLKMRKMNINAIGDSGMFLFYYFVSKLILLYRRKTISFYEIKKSSESS